MKEFLCETQDLAIGYGKTPLASGIALRANPGQILVLIGPNGAGKSTLLKTLAGQLAPLGGAVLLDGQELARIPGNARAQKLALMLPHTRRTELTTCFEFAAAGRIPYTGRLGILSAEDKKQIQNSLELVGAAQLADRDFNRISDGQRQRILRRGDSLAALPVKVRGPGDNDIPPLGQRSAAGEGIQGLAAHDDGAAGSQRAEVLHVPRQGEQQITVPANGPLFICDNDGVHGTAP